jgi:hypothetical protein
VRVVQANGRQSAQRTNATARTNTMRRR